MSLYNKLCDVNNWKYYNRMPFRDYRETQENPVVFILQYFQNGGKYNFIQDVVYQNDEGRARHVINTYFLGLYLKNHLDFLKPKSLFFKDRNFLWAWFLCSLYHDAFFNDLVEDDNEICYDYCKYSEGLLYTQKTIEKYYAKNKNPKTSYNGIVHYDHGIVAASKLYKNYMVMLNDAVRNGEQNIQDLFTENGIYVRENLIINHDTFISLCKIAKVIACHNIFVCDDKTQEEKYEKSGLAHLIVNDNRFHKMPHRNFFSTDDYGKLYYLLALTDTLEPTKRKIDMNDLDFEIENQNGRYVINILGTLNKEYLRGIDNLKNWLKGVKIENNGRRIVLEGIFGYKKQ